MNIGGLDGEFDQAHGKIFRRLAGLVDCAPESRDLRFKMLAGWLQELAVIGNCLEVFHEDIEDVFDPVKVCAHIGRLNDPGGADIRECDQMACEIAAVDG